MSLRRCFSLLALSLSLASLHGRTVTLPVHGLNVAAANPVPVEAEWNESVFLTSRTDVYNHEIARIAVLLSEISYVRVEKNPGENEMIRSYRELGFHDSDIEWNYSIDYTVPNTENNQAAYSFAFKEIRASSGTKKLVLVVLRGTPLTANEWLSNINVSDTTHKDRILHEGFFDTSLNIKKAFCDYLERNKINEKESVFLITGHSRGGALANLLGAMLADEGIISSGRLFVYTFAAPNVTQSQDCSDSRYNFIWNIVNAEDIVPTIPPNRNKWRWRKFGNMKILANYWNTDPEIYDDDFIPRINAIHNKLLLRDYAPFKNGPFFQTQVARILTGIYKDVESYYGRFFGLHGIAEDIFLKVFPENAEDKSDGGAEKERLPFLLRLIQNNMNKNIDGIFDYTMNALIDMHACESYLAIILSLSEKEAYSDLGSAQILISGSYDLAIIGENNKLMARITDGSLELYSMRTPIAVMPLPDKNAVGFPGNQNLKVLVYKGSVIPTRIPYEIEYYDAAGGLLGESEKKYLYPQKNHAIIFEAGKVTLEKKGIESESLSRPETIPLIKEYGIKRNLRLTKSVEFSGSGSKVFDIGLRVGTQEIYGTALAEFRSKKNYGFALGIGHQCSVYGRILFDTEAFARFLSTKETGKKKDLSLVPAGRLSIAYKPRRKVQLFAGALFDLRIENLNDGAFVFTSKKTKLPKIRLGDKASLYPAIQLGIRL